MDDIRRGGLSGCHRRRIRCPATMSECPYQARLHPTQSPTRKKVLATREPSTQDIRWISQINRLAPKFRGFSNTLEICFLVPAQHLNN